MATQAKSNPTLSELKRELRILQKKLEQSEQDRILLEETKDKNDSLLRKVIAELRESKDEVASKRAALKSTVEQLNSTQRNLMESAKMAALGELVAGVTHEVNSQIGIGVTAASYLDGIARDFSREINDGHIDTDNAKKFVNGSRQASEIILKNIRLAADLISSFKKIAVDQSSQSAREYNVHEYLDEIILSLTHRLKRASLKVSVEGDKKLCAYGDPGLLSQIITNLVINALTHAYDKNQMGTLCIRYKTAKDNLHLEFEDDGRGIDSEHLSRIFDPFFTTKRGKGGSGLGLNIVYNIVCKQMAGTIKCESEKGKGTRFLMEFPLRQDKETANRLMTRMHELS